MSIVKRWVNEHGEGHWEISCGERRISCDDAELEEAMNDLYEEMSEAA